MTTTVRIVKHCPPVMQASGESIDPSVGTVIEVPDNVAVQLILNGYAEPEGER